MMVSMAASPARLPTRAPGRAAEQGDRLLLAAGVQRGDDVAQPLGAGDPGGVQEGGQADQGSSVGQPGGAQPGGVQRRQAGPLASDRVSGLLMLCRPGRCRR